MDNEVSRPVKVTWQPSIPSRKHLAEVREWRRTHTYGGYVWFPERKTARPSETGYVLEECRFLLSQAVHPSWIAAALGYPDPRSIHRLAHRHGDREVLAGFAEYARPTASNRRKAAS